MRIEFAPLNIPLRRRLQTAAVLQWVFSFLALAQVCLAAFVLLALSDWWLLALLYAGWLFLDWDTPTSGGRRSQWVRSWAVWGHFRDYFPLTLVKTVDLDPEKNYLFGFHPHGVLVAGAFGNFCTESSGFSRLFPGLRPHLLMLPFWFRLPFFRDYIMCGGLVSSCKSSLSFLLSRPGGGNVAVVAVGGAPEALDARPGALTLQVNGGHRPAPARNRKLLCSVTGATLTSSLSPQSPAGSGVLLRGERALRPDGEPRRFPSEEAAEPAAKHHGSVHAAVPRSRSLPVQLRPHSLPPARPHRGGEAHPGVPDPVPQQGGHRESPPALPSESDGTF